MKIVSEISISEFQSWSGAKDTQKRILEENKENEFDRLIEDLYPDGLTDTQLNDILWFEEEWVFEQLGIEEPEEEESEEDEEEDDDAEEYDEDTLVIDLTKLENTTDDE
jgi:hypothetical protein